MTTTHKNRKYCCIDCFSVSEIQEFIKEINLEGTCYYCRSRGVNIRDVEEVGEFVRVGFLRRYEDAAESVGYESKEGGYQLFTETIDEILIEKEEIFGEALSDPLLLVEDLVGLNGTPYVRKDPYGPPEGGFEDIRNWQEFSDFVKYKQRFTALIDTENYAYLESHPRNFLDNIAEELGNVLLEIIEPGEIIYRARIENIGDKFLHKDLTSPPERKTKNQRMSPTGISFFYGSLEAKTCIREVQPKSGQRVSVAKFKALRQLSILNLASKEIGEESLGIFNEDYNFIFEEYFKPFFIYFSKEISKPIKYEDKAIDYVPSQIFTEFIRLRKFREIGSFSFNKKEEKYFKFNGILFKSSLVEGGENIVLFRGSDISTDQVEDSSNAWLLYISQRSYDISLK